MTSAKGRDIIVIDLAASRAKPHQNGKVYLNLDAIESSGEPKFGQTHFVTEPQSKAERDSGMDRFPVIGNGRAFDNKPSYPQRPSQNESDPQQHKQTLAEYQEWSSKQFESEGDGPPF